MTRLVQPSFGAGELSPEVRARVDIAKYQIGLAQCFNFYVKAQGGISNRPGKEMVCPCKYADKTTWLIPFEFNTEQTYMLEFGDQYVRVIKDGGQVLNASQAITSMTSANPAVLTKNAHGYTNGQSLYLLVPEIDELNGRFVKAANVTANTFEIQDIIFGTAISTVGLPAYTGGGTVASVYELASPYLEADLPRLEFIQSADVMTITHPSYEPRDLSRTGHAAWAFSIINFTPSLTTPAITGLASPTSGTTVNRYVVTAQDDDTGEESLISNIVSLTNNLGTTGNKNTITVSPAVAGADRYNVYKDKNGVFGYIGSTTTLTFGDDNIAPDLSDTAPIPKNPFDAAGKYPVTVTYHEQRKVFGGTDTDPQTFWGTQTGRFKNMGVSLPAKVDDAFTFRLASRQVNAIRHLVSLNDLLIFTSGGEWRVNGGSSSDTIAPNAISVKAQSENGSSFVRPLVIGNSVLYVHEMGKTVSDFGFSYEIDGYKGDDLTILAKHLLKYHEIVQWAYHKEPYRCAWAVRSDGALLGLTYVREHEVWAWHRHGTDGKYKSVGTIKEGNENFAYYVVQRTINGVKAQFIERMHTRLFRNVDECFFVDCGRTRDNFNKNKAHILTLTGGTDWLVEETLALTASGGATPFVAGDVGRIIQLQTKDEDGVITSRCRFEITSYASSTIVSVQALQAVPAELQDMATSHWGFTQTVVKNLYHLEGKKVSVLADGDYEEQTVENGMITLDNDASLIHVGLPYNSDMETLEITGGAQNGSIVGLKKSVPAVDLFVEETRGIKAGPNFNKLKDYKQRSTENYGDPTNAETGVIRLDIGMDWGDGRFCVRQALPLPISINGMIPDIKAGG